MAKNKIKYSLLSFFLLIIIAGCANDTNNTNNEVNQDNSDAHVTVMTSFYPVYEFTQQVAGDRADINMMISGGTDAHHFEPSAQDIVQVNEADLFVYSSEEMETWVPSLLESLDNNELNVVKTSDGMDLIEADEEHNHDDDHDHDHHHAVDPHIWLDPLLAQEQVETIKHALIEVDPEGEDYYEERAQAFNEELQVLHEEFEEAFEGASNRVFFTQHESFGYLAERYDLNQIAVSGLSTEVEPSPSRLSEINQLIEEHDAPVIYYQEGASSSIADTIAEETDTEVSVLYDLEVVPEDLQAEGYDYLDIMRENLEALKLSIY